jgi:hypothetical protein
VMTTVQPRAPVRHATAHEVQDILIELRDATGFDNGCWVERACKGWPQLGSFSTLEEVGNGVYGVSVSDEGRLTALFLAECGLTGPIPASIGGLDDLQRLYLYGNHSPVPFRSRSAPLRAYLNCGCCRRMITRRCS